MAISLQQTDTTDSIAADTCTVSVLAASTNQAEDGGTAGSGDRSRSVTGESSVTFWLFKGIIATGTTWDAGTWTVRWEITTANMFITWDAVYMCRLNSSEVVQESLGSATSLGINLAVAGVVSTDVTGSAATPSVGDSVGIAATVSNSSMSNQSFNWSPTQIITSPFTAGVGLGIPIAAYHHIHHNLA